jgi:hypothetical protein
MALPYHKKVIFVVFQEEFLCSQTEKRIRLFHKKAKHHFPDRISLDTKVKVKKGK